jgi:hypothetical protein
VDSCSLQIFIDKKCLVRFLIFVESAGPALAAAEPALSDRAEAMESEDVQRIALQRIQKMLLKSAMETAAVYDESRFLRHKLLEDSTYVRYDPLQAACASL